MIKPGKAIDRMWYEVISFEPQTVREKFVYPELLVAAKSMNDCRRSRLVTSRSRVSPILWVVLVTGAASTIVFTYTFGIKSLRAQIFMTALVALTLSLNLYLWAIYSNPFYGLLRVAPEAFKMDMEHFQFYFDNPDEQRWHKFEELGSIEKSKRKTKVDDAVDQDDEPDIDKNDVSKKSLESNETKAKEDKEQSESEEVDEENLEKDQKDSSLIQIPSDFSREETNE